MNQQFKFKLNRYNWLSQRLLALHQYEQILNLRQHLVHSYKYHLEANKASLVESEHLSYIHSLALMKTSTRLQEVVLVLQRLNYDKNGQFFLLLCQCLLYLGNFDSVVALCKQVINKEINSFNTSSSSNIKPNQFDTINPTEANQDLLDLELEFKDEGATGLNNSEKSSSDKRKLNLYTEFISNETEEFKKIFANINQNLLINEPKLWFIFGLALEFQSQYKEAILAFKVASKLSAGNAGETLHNVADHNETPTIGDLKRHSWLAVTSNYYMPHLKFADASIRYQDDFRAATRVLAVASLVCTQNYTVTPMLALLLSVQNSNFSSSAQNSSKAIKIIARLESHFASNKNPALGYNNLALRCKQRFREQINSQQQKIFEQTFYEADQEQQLYNFPFDNYSQAANSLEIGGEAGRLDLNFQLAKMHITINSLIQEFNSKIPISATKNAQSDRYQSELVNQLDILIDSMKQTDSSCWNSASLWNNLGICYLVKRRYIACLSCILKAHKINSLDWRINYNLALACCHVGLITKAFTCLMAARNYHPSNTPPTSNFSKSQSQTNNSSNCPIISSLLAICYSLLGDVDEARRLFIETIRPQKKLTLSGVTIAPLVNYLIFLHQSSDSSEQHIRLKLHLLDLLEQAWLQRHQNDPQFNHQLLNIAVRIGEETLLENSHLNLTRKAFAWTKVDASASLTYE